MTLALVIVASWFGLGLLAALAFGLLARRGAATSAAASALDHLEQAEALARLAIPAAAVEPLAEGSTALRSLLDDLVSAGALRQLPLDNPAMATAR